jgi:hypothetical protein
VRDRDVSLHHRVQTAVGSTSCVMYTGDSFARGKTAGVRFPVAATNGDFLLATVSIPAEAHPASYSVGTRGVLFPGLKWPGREADHSYPSSAKVKNARSYTSTPRTFSCRGIYYNPSFKESAILTLYTDTQLITELISRS